MYFVPPNLNLATGLLWRSAICLILIQYLCEWSWFLVRLGHIRRTFAQTGQGQNAISQDRQRQQGARLHCKQRSKTCFNWCRRSVSHTLLLASLLRTVTLGGISLCHCCLLPRCEALRTCCSGFPVATKCCNSAFVVVCLPGSSVPTV